MNTPKLMRLRATKSDNGCIVIDDDNNHYRFCWRWPQPPPVVATLSTLKGTVELSSREKRSGSLVPRSALPAEVSSAAAKLQRCRCRLHLVPATPSALKGNYSFLLTEERKQEKENRKQKKH